MNAGGVDKAYKSSAPLLLAIKVVESGKRVSNTLVRTVEFGIAHRKVG